MRGTRHEDGSVRVGTAPEGQNDPVILSAVDLWPGCYVGAAEPQQGTRVLQDWCVQWAENGFGFCYIHPRGPEPRELLARLPAERFDDVVWIDFKRSNRSTELDIPERQRVAVDPLAGPDPGIRPKFLETDPIAGRVADWIAATTEGDHDTDWNVKRLASVLMPQLYGDDGPTRLDIENAASTASVKGTAEPLLQYAQGPVARTQIKHAAECDSDVFTQLFQLLGWPHDLFPSNPHLGEQTYEFASARSNRHIILVTGDADRPGNYSVFRAGSHLLMQTVLRRLWEEAQSTTDNYPIFPLVLDGAVELSAGEGTLVKEICRKCNSTPVTPILRGPHTDDIPRDMHEFISPNIESRVICKGWETGGVKAAFETGNIDAVERTLEAQLGTGVEEGNYYWVTTGNEGMLTADPREKIDSQIALPNDPPPTRHGIEKVSEVITESVNRHGGDHGIPTELPAVE